MLFKIPSHFHAVNPHEHVWLDKRTGELNVEYMNHILSLADWYGIERMGISCPVLTSARVTAAEFRHVNDAVLQAVSMHPDRFFGLCFVDPADPGAAAEIDRCIAAGMRGVKLYHQHYLADEIQRPVMERAAHYGVPVLMHAAHCTDRYSRSVQPLASDSEQFLRALEMFPDTILIQAHIGGGGDWEWSLRKLYGLRNPRFFIDLAGSVCDAGIARRTVEAVGIDSVLFSTDMSFPESVVKTLSAGFTEEELQKIFHDNWTRLEGMRK